MADRHVISTTQWQRERGREAPGAAPRFADVLRRLRLAAGLTQSALAERAGLSVRGISDLERGVKIRPRAYTVRHFADALAFAGAEGTMFENSAIDPARLAQVVQAGVQPPTLDTGGRAGHAPWT